MKNRISTGLAKYGNYHPQVVVRVLEEKFQSDLNWNVSPRGSAELYTCLLQVRPYGAIGKQFII
jgi:hypothetical protein